MVMLMHEPLTVTLFGKRVMADVIKVILRPDRSGLFGWALSPMTHALVKGRREKGGPQSRKPRGDRVEWCSQTPRNAGSPEMLEEASRDPLQGLWRELGTLMSDIWLLGL